MHTSEYEHIKEGKREKFLLLTSSLYCLSLYLLLPAFTGNHLLLPASSGIPRRTMNKPLHCLFSQTMGFLGFHRPSDGLSVIIPTHSCLTIIVRSCGRVRNPSVPSASLPGWTIEKLYALYASKNRLCALCENTTPELTAYNAYRNANRRVRRAEGTKMYALKDAYKVHTECIQVHTSAYKHIKE